MEFNDKEKKMIISVICAAVLLTLITIIIFVVAQKSDSVFKKEETTLYELTSTESTVVTTFSDDELEELLKDYTSVFTTAETKPEDNPHVVEGNTIADNSLKVPQDKNAIVSQYINAINGLKNSGNFKLNYNTGMNVSVDEITGGSLAQKILQSAINDATVVESYNFVNGTDGSKGVTADNILPPANSGVTLVLDDVISADVISQSASGYTVKLVLDEEHLTTNQMPGRHANCLPPLEMDMSESGLTINSYNVTFSNSTIVARFDGQGRLVYIENTAVSPGMECTGTAVITMSLKMHGNITTVYNITY